MKRIGRAAALASLLLGAGCYKYVPEELGTVPPNAYVRVFLTRRGLSAIPEGIPVSQTFVSGRIARQTRDSLLIQVPVANAVQGGGLRDLAQNVYVPLAEVVSLDRRQFSGGRTVLAFAAGVGFVGVTVLGVNAAGGTSETERGSGNAPSGGG